MGFKGENNLLHANEIFFEAKGMVKACSFWYSFIYACEQLDEGPLGAIGKLHVCEQSYVNTSKFEFT